MTRLRHLLIAAIFLSAVPPDASAVEPLEGQRGGARPGWLGAVPAANTAQRAGIGLGFSNDAFANGFTGWDGVYLPDFDRVAERNTVYGLPRETLGLSDSNALTAICCQRSYRSASPQRQASSGSARPVSPSIYVFAIVRKKGWDIDLTEGWKLQAGGRSREYSQTFQTKIGFLTVERFWESFRASYSFQLERSKGLSLAPAQVLMFDFLYGPRDSVGLTYADGREFADLGALGILNTETRTVGVRGQHWFQKAWAFTYQAGHSDHGSSLPAYQQVRLGLQRSF